MDNDFKLDVECQAEAVRLVTMGRKYDAIISIANPPTCLAEQQARHETIDLFQKSGATVLSLHFKDTCDPENAAPTMEHVGAIREFAAWANFRRVLVHCKGGISRSPAVAFIFMKARGMTERDAWTTLKKLKKRFEPNKLLLLLEHQ